MLKLGALLVAAAVAASAPIPNPNPDRVGNWVYVVGRARPLQTTQIQQTKTEQADPNARNGDASANPRGAVPASVEIVNAPKNEERIDAYAAEEQREASDSRTETIAWWALGLTFAQALIFAITLIYTVRGANAAKSAAQTAERALTDLETPYLYPTLKETSLFHDFAAFERYDHPTSPHTDAAISVSFKIKNFGRTVGLLRFVNSELVHLTAMPETPRTDILPSQSLQSVLEPGKETDIGTKDYARIPISNEAFRSIKKGDSRIFLYGQITFADIFGADYVQTFCLSWDYKTKGFVPWGTKYNKRVRTPAEA